ncbi:MAG: GNAT family N-acetyltransferase [Chloroflexi bacterium]|nr:MAG: GNAT family N-acetyltransferase [Chloroflexota bacterium]
MSGHDRSWSPRDRPPEEIEAGPIVLRRWVAGDLDGLADAVERSRSHLSPWQDWAATADRESLPGFLSYSEWTWDACTDFGFGLRELDGRIVGGAGLHARVGRNALEIGYWVAADRINRGYATAAAGALAAAAFGLPGVGRVEIHCDEANLRSAAVPRKLGFQLDRVEEDAKEAPAEAGRSMIWVLSRP